MNEYSKCQQCGKPTRNRKAKHCSHECRWEYERINEMGNVKPDCAHCGKPVGKWRKRYCSDECRHLANGQVLVNGSWMSLIKIVCKHCSNEVFREFHNQVYCTPACRRAADDAKRKYSQSLEKDPADGRWVTWECHQGIARFRHIKSKRIHTRGDWRHIYELQYHYADGTKTTEPMENDKKMLRVEDLIQMFQLRFANHDGLTHLQAAIKATT